LKSRAEVSAILKDYQSSGLVQRVFAQEQGVSVSTLQFWLRRERNDPPSSSSRSTGRTLVPVHVVPSVRPASLAALRVELKNGRRVEVPSDFPASVLACLVSALEVDAC
jgi:hypothetical protein